MPSIRFQTKLKTARSGKITKLKKRKRVELKLMKFGLCPHAATNICKTSATFKKQAKLVRTTPSASAGLFLLATHGLHHLFYTPSSDQNNVQKQGNTML